MLTSLRHSRTARALLVLVGLVAVTGAGLWSTDSVTVEEGDTLYALSREHDVPVSDLVSLNDLEDPDLLQIGQLLIVREASLQYTVARGDTLYGIARAHAVPVADLLGANELDDPDLLSPGQILEVPNRATTAEGPSDAADRSVGASAVESPPAAAPTAPASPAAPGGPSGVSVGDGERAVVVGRVGSEGPSVEAAPPPAARITYVVQPGDTLSRIARRFNTTVEAIQVANAVVDPGAVVPGLRLTVPFGSG